MIILGIESTAHTFGIGIVTNQGEILANEVDSYSCKKGGMILDQVAEHHRNVAEDVLKKALKKANLDWDKIDFIAYSAGPGLDPALWEGYHKAKEWGKKYKKVLKGINHCCAHLSIGKQVNKLKDPVYLYVSGVNTQIINYEGGKYRVMGETLDIGLGNMLDKLGRTLGLGFPAGPKIEELAKKGKYVELPYVVKGTDVSFSGILSKVQQLWQQQPTFKQLLKKQGKTIALPHSKEHQKIILDSHIAHLLPKSMVDLCIILTCSNLKKLQKNLEKKKYSKKKIRENLDTEIFQICLIEAQEKKHKLLVVDCKELKKNILKKVKSILV